MASAPRPGDKDAICLRLQEELAAYGATNPDEWRDRVRALVPAFMRMRDLGCSLNGPTPPSSARQKLLEYLLAYPRQVVAGDELLVVSGIGEWARRIRELRVEHGWPIVSGLALKQMAAEEDMETLDGINPSKLRSDDYILLELQPDLSAADRWETANKIRRKDGSVQDKILEFLLANIGAHVTGDELRYIARNKTEWARRTRELRTEEGWRLVTKFTGKPELPVGVYVLESDKQLPPHDRNINDRVRKRVFRRDDRTCRQCGWNRSEWDPDDARHLEAHHVEHHRDGGSNEEDNLITLCNLCHDEEHVAR